MLVKILKAFPYSADGMRTRALIAESLEDVRDELIIGLMEEGYVGDPDPAVAQSNVEASPGDAQPTADVSGAAIPTELHDGDKSGGSVPKSKRSLKA